MEVDINDPVNCIKVQVIDPNEGLDDTGHVDNPIDHSQCFFDLAGEGQHTFRFVMSE